MWDMIGEETDLVLTCFSLERSLSVHMLTSIVNSSVWAFAINMLDPDSSHKTYWSIFIMKCLLYCSLYVEVVYCCQRSTKHQTCLFSPMEAMSFWTEAVQLFRDRWAKLHNLEHMLCFQWARFCPKELKVKYVWTFTCCSRFIQRFRMCRHHKLSTLFWNVRAEH